MQAELRVKLLGDLSLSVGGVPVTAANSPRLQALVAYLLLNRDAPQRRQQVAFLFWPDSTEKQAQTNLRKLLHDLRAAWPEADAYIRVDHKSVRWQPDVSIPFSLDVTDFERTIESASGESPEQSARTIEILQAAIDLYAGDLLTSCYDEWIASTRERLREQFLGALDRLIALLERAEYRDQAIVYARRLLRYDPLLEENYRRLMRLYLQGNDRAGALNTYKQCTVMLQREFGTVPAPATIDILKQIEAGEVSVAGARASALPGMPAQTTAFLGRESELVELSALLRAPQVRLITLTGMPGTGKTRLSMQASAALTGLFEDGVYFVPLAAIVEPAEKNLMGAVAVALDVTDSGAGESLVNMKKYLADKSMLLVLDNFEHLIAAAPFVADLLAGCAGLKILTTSRSPLNLRGEHEFAVSPLPVPPRDAPARLEEMVRYESVALFVDRALEVLPRLDLTPANLRAIGEICRRLEGLPLSIELAAARVKALPPPAILARLDRRLKLLVGGKRDMPTRQQALRTSIEWSYNLLNAEEKGLFATLGVFSGGFSPAGVSAAAGELDQADCLDTLSSLLDKSLLVRLDAQEGELRFGMLETLKEYAVERLREARLEDDISHKHALYYLMLAESSADELVGPHQAQWMKTLEQEHDNIRAALRWALEHEAGLALRISGAMGRFWEIRGYLSEGRSWLQSALDLTPGEVTPERARVLYACGSLAVRQRDYEVAGVLLTECREAYRELGDKVGLSNALNTLAVLMLDSDYGHALALHEESLALRREMGDKRAIASSLHNIALLKTHQGKWDEAHPLAIEVITTWQELNSPYGMARALYLLGMIAAGQSNYGAAQEHLEEGLRLSRTLSDDWLMAWMLHALGDVLYMLGKYEEANAVFAETESLFGTLGDSLGKARVLISLAREAFRTGEYDTAKRLFDEALSLGIRLDNSLLIGCCLAGFAALAGTRGELHLAARLFGCASDLLATLYTSLERCAMTLNMGELRAALNAEEAEMWDLDWQEGMLIPWSDAVSLARTMLA